METDGGGGVGLLEYNIPIPDTGDIEKNEVVLPGFTCVLESHGNRVLHRRV